MATCTNETAHTTLWSCVYNGFLCTAYIAVSAALIRFNKFLIHEDRFPFAMTLTAIHMSCSLVCCCVLYLARPSAFPGMEAIRNKSSFAKVLRWFIPVGVLFAIALWTSNQAYLYASVTFLQFMKEANVILVFSISCAVGLQACNRIKLAVIFWIIAGSAMCVRGEINFTMIGFALQLVSQFAECSRNVAGECILTGSDLKLDPLTYTMLLAPTCLVFLLVGHIFVWSPLLLPRFLMMWHYLLPNAMLAFTLNVIVGAVIKEVSAVGFILSGLCKDILLVAVSAALFGEHVAPMQVTGFVVVLCGVFTWSYIKVFPQSAFVKLVENLLYYRIGDYGDDVKSPTLLPSGQTVATYGGINQRV